jgi:OOP family OmpA-OmpF porin
LKLFKQSLLACLVSSACLAHAALAEDVKSYVVGASGVVKNSAGECWRTPDMTEKMLEECGYAKPAPEPAPVQVEFVAAPSAATMTTKVMEKIVLSAAMLFAFDSAVLSDDAKAVIDERIERIRGRAKLTSIMKVVGHTDSTGPETYNQQLSLARAQAVADYIAENSYRVTAADMEVIGMGESEPVASNDNAEGRRLNRRVEIFAEAVVDQ